VDPPADKHLEVRLFDLLELRGGVRLGQLVQLRRLSRTRGITLLHAAFDAGQVGEAAAHSIAREAGLVHPTSPTPTGSSDDHFGDLPRLAMADTVVPSAEFDDSVPDAIQLDSIDISLGSGGGGTDLNVFDAFDPAQGGPPVAPPRAGAGPPPMPILKAPPPEPRPVRETAELLALGSEASRPVAAPTERSTVPMALPVMQIGIPPEDTLPYTSPPHAAIVTEGLESDTKPPGGIDDDGSSVEIELPESGGRYALGAELGRGGMGQVLEAQDLSLHRSVALKLLFDQDDASMRLRFVDEARYTGQLQHPGVPPVYELGRLDDGRMFFAMKRLEGRTLRDLLEDLRAGEPEATRQYGRVRLLTLFAQVCRTIAYAHSRGLMHRDLKPDNIMLGEFGEITVMDWGLAKPFDAPADGEVAEIGVTLAARSVDGRFSTQAGEVTGTPHYMPPEQAAGRIDELGPHSDVYSLGAVLYELLTLEPPYDGPSSRRIREAVVAGQLVAPSERAPDRDVPPAIEALCVGCLAVRPTDRPGSAAWVADQIDEFLAGEQDRARKAAERDALLAKGREAAQVFAECSDAHRAHQNRVALGMQRIDPWAPLEARRRLWAEEDAERKARIDAARALSEALAAHHAALAVDGGHGPTRRALAGLYYAAFESAERAGDRVQMAQYEHLVRAFDDGAFSARLEGDGALEITGSPTGLEATLFPWVRVDRVLTRGEARPLGRTPVRVSPLQMGSYVLELRGPGMSERAVPVRVGRQESVRLRLRLFPDSVVGEGFVHVSGGACRLWGDPLAQLAAPQATIEIDDFFISRRPVSSEAWFDFLLDVARTEGPSVAQARVPRSGPNRPLWPLAADGAPETVPDRDAEGRPWRAEWPVVCVSCDDAEAYCAWLTRETGVRHRLPTEGEWEKAARGVDGRLFPWGDAWAPTFCHMGISREGPPGPGPVGGFAADISPYGVLDMAGGVSEWTSSWIDEGQRQRIVKGGHWASGPTECRSASRFTQPSQRVLPTLGFRIVREAPK